ncbi:MAG: redoxin family protein [Bacteroidota bacterium]
MKNLKIITILLILAVLAGCQNKEEKASATTIRGEILHPPSDSPLIIMKGAVRDTIGLDSSNHFSMTYHTKKPAYFQVKLRRQVYDLYLQPGDTITLRLDASKNRNALEFINGDTKASEYLLAYRDIRMHDELFNTLLRNDSLELFTLRNEYIRDSLNDLLESYSDSIDDDDFFETEKQRISYLLGNNQITYNRYYRYINDTSLPDSVGFFAFLEEIPLENPEMLKIQEYMQYLKSAFAFFNENTPTEKEEKDYLGDIKFNLRSIDDVIEDDEVASALYYEMLMHYAEFQGFVGLDNEYAYMQKNLEDSAKLAEMERLHAFWDEIAPGKKAPGFAYPNPQGDSIALRDFEGKPIYIDVWATWCGPCQHEIPYLESLYQDYKNTDIEIVSISVDEKRKAWMNFIEEENPGWLQLHTGGWDCSLCADYHIAGIPRFLLIDRDGTIISTTAPLPSSDEIRPLFDKLLQDEI